MFFSKSGDFILMLVRTKFELGDFLLCPDSSGKPAVGGMGLAVEGDLSGVQNFSARTEFQSELSALALEHTCQGERTVDGDCGSRIGLADAFAVLSKAEEGNMEPRKALPKLLRLSGWRG